MKKLLVFTVLILGLAFGAGAIAEKDVKKCDGKGKDVKKCDIKAKAETKCSKGVEKQADAKCPKEARRGRKAKFAKLHKKVIAQLQAIRAIAFEENAHKTVEALDEFIAKKQKQSDKRFAARSEKKGCPPDCTKPCCAMKKDIKACSQAKDIKACPSDAAKSDCCKKKGDKSCPGEIKRN